MKTKINKKPRVFSVGFANKFQVKDFGKIFLNTNEQITFINNNKEYDFGMKNWGYYATPSINGRLKNNGYKTFLVKNIYNKIYIMVVNNLKIDSFEDYINYEKHKILLRLDNFTNEEDLIKSIKEINTKNKLCERLKCRKIGKNISTIFLYKKPPTKEPDYKIRNYKRSIVKCKVCGHFYAKHKIDTEKFYKEDYSTISHGKNIAKKFHKIKKMGKNSDNFDRVSRFINFFKNYRNKKIFLLDVGSGISIFLSSLKTKVNWKLSGIEPDINFVKFGRKQLGLKIYHSNFNKKIFKNKKFNIISLNKVAEHVKDPILFFKNCKYLLNKNGYVYVEVPDGTTASEQKRAKEQEEFAVDHLHVFSLDSLYSSLNFVGFKVLKIDKIKEKSGKYTLYAFAKKIN
jgi:2-polyprenyl-3-methyl-5-hydroxy-6-metoxy-1,4-benzoquinol methylase